MMKNLIVILFAFNLQSLICNLELFAQTWSPAGAGLSSQVNVMMEFNNNLYVGGGFGTAGGIDALGIAKWNGAIWDSVGSGVTGGIVESFAVYNGELYVGGGFSSAGGLPNTGLIAKWDGTMWSEVGGGAVEAAVLSINALAVYKGELYAGGKYTSIGGIGVNHIARWDGTSWKNVGGGISGSIPSVHAMVVYNDDLYVSGEFISAGGIISPRMARWDSTQWDSVGSGFNGGVTEMTVDTISNTLYAGGGFTSADGVLVYGLAKWDGVEWARVDSTVDSVSAGRALGIYKGELYIGNSESKNTWAGETLNFIGRWDGNQWNALGAGTSNTVLSMAVFDNDLYIGGGFNQAGGMTVNYIARWNMGYTTGIPAVKKKETVYLGNSIPNPAKGTVIIPYYLPQGSKGAIKLYGIKGELVKEIRVSRGDKEVEISLDGFSEGTYLYSIEVNGAVKDSKRMIIAK